jgi:hypothetical protein
MDRPEPLRFSAIPRPAFGTHAQHAEPTPGVFRGKAAHRRMLQFREARELLTALPGPGESLHRIQSGTLDLCVLLVALVDLHPAPCLHMRIATLCYARRNCVELLGALESRKIGRLTLLASHFFRSHYKELSEWFGGELAAFPGCKLATARSHAKIVCMDFADGTALVCEGSANLRSNKNLEQLTISNDEALAAWYGAWIDSQVNADAE